METNQPNLFPKTREEVIRENLNLFDLPIRISALIENILQGNVREQSLVCCHSACDVCNATIRTCLRKIRNELESN
ncbi:hypothetical protein [Leptospira stimsonii]|uniref:Uncharacterized protein n=1 Tax=Leptospira stimsonii TaxID=2202203 RepID=A0A396YPH5_9LEPT|nr:hypothetical protein [Leptospira stimsonii]RHX84635.1 hypothetical protein DLM75_22405 [Leptospira stimsonii]